MTKEELIIALEKLNKLDSEYASGSVTSLLVRYINDIEIYRTVNKVHRSYK